MTTIPAAAASVWCAHHPAAREVATASIVMVGDRPEVCLNTVARQAPHLAHALEAWWTQTRDLWAAASTDRLAGHTWIRTRRPLVDTAQVTAKKDKRDLTDEFAALTQTGPLARLVVEATATDPDVRSIRARARALGGSFTVDDSGAAATLTAPMEGTMWWPNALGGPAWPGEVGRTATLTLRYAAWRDRRVRRLAAVNVTVDEIWADPLRVATTTGPSAAQERQRPNRSAATTVRG